MTGGVPVQGTKTVAIMQPYFFPYVGYFQLARAVDAFWLLDTVKYIPGGWMNRNNLLVNGAKTLFTIPVTKGARTEPILSQTLAPQASRALAKLERTVAQSYASAPHRDTVLSLLRSVGEFIGTNPVPTDFTDVAEFALQETFRVLDLPTPIHRISSLSLDPDLIGQDRIIAACQQIGARRYINMVGGQDLYNRTDFERNGIKLVFLEAGFTPYNQGTDAFVPALSILDAIARVEPANFPSLLENYRLG